MVYYRQKEGGKNQLMGAGGENPSSELQKESLPDPWYHRCAIITKEFFVVWALPSSYVMNTITKGILQDPPISHKKKAPLVSFLPYRPKEARTAQFHKTLALPFNMESPK